MRVAIEKDMSYKCIADIGDCRTIDDFKSAVKTFISIVEKTDEMNRWSLIRQLDTKLSEWTDRHLSAAKSELWNAAIVPPEHAPLMSLATIFPFGASPPKIMEALRYAIKRFDEFTAPIQPTIKEQEITDVLAAVQTNFKILSIIAPTLPIKIVRLNNSHAVHNSECGVPTNLEREAVIFLFSPRKVKPYDQVFIFAHEIGHALQLSLTRDLETLPDKFDDFNELLQVNLPTLKDKQEAFADAVAYAILGDESLQEHLPAEFHKGLLPYFERYVKYITAMAYNRMKSEGKLQAVTT